MLLLHLIDGPSQSSRKYILRLRRRGASGLDCVCPAEFGLSFGSR